MSCWFDVTLGVALMNVVQWSQTLFVMPALALLQAGEEPQDLTLNYLIIGVLLVVAGILGVIVIKRRQREKDDDWDA